MEIDTAKKGMCALSILTRHFFLFWYKCNYIVVLSGILFAFQARCQSEESLLRAIQIRPVIVHDSLFYELFKINRTTDVEMAGIYIKQTFHLSSKYNHSLMRAKACRGLGYIYEITNQTDSSRKYYHQGIKISSANNFTDRLIDLYNDLGVLHQRLDVYDSALHYFVLSYNLAIKAKNLKAQAIASSNIGLVDSYLENYTDALHSFKEAIAIKNSNGITVGLTLDIINLARVLNELGFYADAIKELEKITLNCKTGCDDNTLADLDYQYGYTSLKKGQTGKGYKFFIAALDLARKSNNRQTIANSLFQLSCIDLNNKAYPEATAYLLEAEKIAFEIQHKRLLVYIYENLTRLYKQTGNRQKSMQYESLYVSLKDSIFNRAIANRVKNIQLGEQRKKSDTIIAEKETALSKSYVLIALLTLNIVFAFVIVFLIARALRSSRRHREAMGRQVVKMMDHEDYSRKELFRSHIEFSLLQNRVSGLLTGPVSSLRGLVYLIKKAVKPEEFREAAEKIFWICADIFTVLDNMHELVLYKSQDVTLEEIDVAKLVEDINNDFKKMKSFLLLTVTIDPSVRHVIKSDRELIRAAVSHAIRYFDHTKETPVLELIFSQDETQPLTRMTIKHYSTTNRFVPVKNQFSHLTVMVIVGRIGGDFRITQFVDHTLFDIFIPTEFSTLGHKPESANISFE